MAPELPTYYPWTNLTVISISGNDRVKWLNNLVTNDVKKVSATSSVECFVTDVKGRTLAHGALIEENQRMLYFSWGADQAARLISHWDRYIIREDVQLFDESKTSQWVLANGVASDKSIPFHPLGENWSLIKLDATQTIDSWLASLPMPPRLADDNAIEWDRIAHRWPMVGKDFDEKNLPQELDRNGSAISFTKGCYLGQETVARLDALGQVQKKLVQIEIHGLSRDTLQLAPNTPIFRNEQEAGYITSIAHDGRYDRWFGLAYVKRAYFTSGTELQGDNFMAIIV
jgi:tRNA-modifying protein YgfZ